MLKKKLKNKSTYIILKWSNEFYNIKYFFFCRKFCQSHQRSQLFAKSSSTRFGKGEPIPKSGDLKCRIGKAWTYPGWKEPRKWKTTSSTGTQCQRIWSTSSHGQSFGQKGKILLMTSSKQNCRKHRVYLLFFSFLILTSALLP